MMLVDEEERINIVREGYDEIAPLYHAERETFDIDGILKDFMRAATSGGHILDAGCGAGVPVARTLIESGFQVTGVDISQSMLKLARKHVPSTSFILQDMTKLNLEPESFDGIISTFAIIHVPRTLHAEVFSRFHRVLRGSGSMLVSLAMDESDGVDEYHGAPMYWSHYDKETSLEIIRGAGFRIVWSRRIETREEQHFWIFAKKQ
ncbi:MAG: class I SAM-dependent methyltransferase [Candidatus Thorarchaeota archaeon]|jgi:ubiquinone/menaquinone biosynthesis C-methylase UbiE